MARRVLVVEDDSDLRHIYAAVLFYNGFKVDEAATALEAVSRLERYKPDVILLDLVLPGAHGLAFAEMLKNAPGTKAIPIVGMSAYENAARAINAGCEAFLEKPFRPDALVETVRRLLPESA